MVQLALYSPKGNQGTRYFPYHGYLGLTPLRVEGAVRTKLDGDMKPISAKSLTVAVRCYESRISRLGASQIRCLAEQTQVLWKPTATGAEPSTSTTPSAAEFADLGDTEHTFRITLPASIGGLSTVSYPDYKVYWRVEAVLEHVNLPGVGHRQVKFFELPLVRHDVPAPLPRPSAPMSPLSPVPSDSSSSPVSHPYYQSATKGRMPIFRYNLTIPVESIGPQDFVSVPISILPLENGMAVKSASLIIERRLHLYHHQNPSSGTSSPTPSPTDYPSPPSTSQRPRRPRTAPSDGSLTPTTSTTAVFQPMAMASAATETAGVPSTIPSSISISASNSSLPVTVSDHNERTPLLRPSLPASTPPAPLSTPRVDFVATNVIASSESSGSFFSRLAPSPSSSRSSLGASPEVWSKTLTVQWPNIRSNNRWAIGETARTELAHVRYVVRVKVVVVSPSLGTETLELDGDVGDRDLLVVSTNEAERRLALAKYTESVAHKKSKSQSPKRRARALESEEEDRDRSKGAKRHGKKQLPSPPDSPPTAVSPPLWNPGANTSGSSATSSELEPITPPSFAGELPVGHAVKIAKGKKPSKERAPRAPRMSRRPHTSAGPGDASGPANPGWQTSASRQLATHGDAFVARDVQKDLRQSALVSDHEMRAWEAELARIEAVSRSSSLNMLGARPASSRVGAI